MSKTSFNLFSPCPFLETGSCVWLRTNSSSDPGTCKKFGMRNGEVWGRLLYSLLSWGKCVSARGRLVSSWGWKTSQNFPVSPRSAQGLRESVFYKRQVALKVPVFLSPCTSIYGSEDTSTFGLTFLFPTLGQCL